MVDDPRLVARQLLEAFRHDTDEARSAPAVRKVRPVFWKVGVAAIGLLGVIEVGLAVLSDTEPVVSAPPRLLALYRGDVCAQRQADLLRGIARFRRDNGRLPDTLPELGPSYLSAAPIDPVSSRPYAYTRQGERVVLSCPNPWLHETRPR